MPQQASLAQASFAALPVHIDGVFPDIRLIVLHVASLEDDDFHLATDITEALLSAQFSKV